MNQETSKRGVGRLTGRSEVDAGILRYRQLLASEHHGTSSQRGRLVLVSFTGRRWRKVAATVTASLLIALAVAVGAAARVAGGDCLYLTPGLGGGGMAVSVVERVPQLAMGENSGIVTGTGGSFEQLATAKFPEHRFAAYNGELCCGPYQFVP